MAGVRSWLEEIGLAEYANAFEANDIDLEILRDLTDADLKQLGVTSTGHRVRLRTAIGDKPRDVPGSASQPPADDPRQHRAEPPTQRFSAGGTPSNYRHVLRPGGLCDAGRAT